MVMNKTPPLEVPVAFFVAELLRHLNREQVDKALKNTREACYERTPDVDSYSLHVARRLLDCGDALKPSEDLARELAEARVQRAHEENNFDAERYRKIAPVQDSLGEIVPRLRGLKNSLTMLQEALGEPLEALEPFVEKDRWR